MEVLILAGKNNRVPRSIFVVIIAAFVAMYAYAAFFDIPEPETTVTDFYQAYFDKDFATASTHLSVFWAAQILPEYNSLPPVELLKSRSKIEKNLTKLITTMEENNEMPANIKINIMSEYTREGENSAIVVYGFEGDPSNSGMEAAVLIRENGKLRIFNLSPINPALIEQIKAIDVSVLDENFGKLLQSE